MMSNPNVQHISPQQIHSMDIVLGARIVALPELENFPSDLVATAAVTHNEAIRQLGIVGFWSAPLQVVSDDQPLSPAIHHIGIQQKFVDVFDNTTILYTGIDDRKQSVVYRPSKEINSVVTSLWLFLDSRHLSHHVLMLINDQLGHGIVWERDSRRTEFFDYANNPVDASTVPASVLELINETELGTGFSYKMMTAVGNAIRELRIAV